VFDRFVQRRDRGRQLLIGLVVYSVIQITSRWCRWTENLPASHGLSQRRVTQVTNRNAVDEIFLS